MIFGIVLPLFILPAIYGLVILGLVMAFRKMQVSSKKAILLGFLVFGIAVGFLTAWAWPADSSSYFNVLGALLGDQIHNVSIQYFGDIISPQAHYHLLERPTWAHFLLDRLADLARRNAETLARAGVDVLALDDDVGMPGTMMISPATWREFFKRRLTTIIQAARAIKPDLRVLYHSDGYFEPIVGDLMDIGMNAINPLQPDHMDAVASANGSAASWRCGARWATTLLSALPHLTPSPGRSSTASRPWAAPGSSSVPPTTLTSRTSRGRTSPPSWKPSRRTVRTEQYLSPRRH